MQHHNTQNSISSFEQKWSPEIAQYSFTQIPNLLINCQGHLGISDNELVTLMQLISFWFEHDGQIYPSIARLSKYSKKGYSTIQARLKRLHNKGLVKIVPNNGNNNYYDIVPLINKLYEHQKNCKDPPRKQAGYNSNMSSLPSPYLRSKEYNPKRKFNNKTESIKDIFSKQNNNNGL
jgi:predicted transcriptional regulator